ncbi:MAG TPA: DOMON-like domain-containing protein [Gammaproteobacteria bacterium]
MTDHALLPHRADERQAGVHAIVARVQVVPRTNVVFEYRLRGDLSLLAIPHRWRSQRTEQLWEHTCFEAFIAPGSGSRYFELNFSPSTQWAAYEFDGYRHGMRPLELAKTPKLQVAASANELHVTAAIELAGLADAPWPWRIGLTAVVEDRTGARAYYALEHAREKPDFHDAASFTVLLDGSTR